MKQAFGYACYVHTLGVGMNSWKELPIPSLHRLCNFPPVFINGYLHWMIHSNEIENLEDIWTSELESKGHILSMDINREVFHKTSHPTCMSGFYTLLELNKQLCFVDHFSNTQLKLWVLKDLQKEDWVEECSVDIREDGTLSEGNHGFLVDLYPSSIFGDDAEYKIVFKSYQDLYFSYSMGTKELKRLPFEHLLALFSDFDEKYSPIKHTNSLFAVGKGRSSRCFDS
ncbi:hypothetical protein ACLOJK_017156 [Asimina triloba]